MERSRTIFSRAFFMGLFLMAVMVYMTLSAHAANISPNGSYSGSLTEETTKCEYTFTLAQSGRLDIDFTSDSDAYDISMIIRGSEKDKYDFYYFYVKNSRESIAYDLAAGKYTFVVEKNHPSYNGSFSFNSSFSPAEETYTGDNNTIDSVKNGAAVPFGKTIKGHLAMNDSSDYYKVVLPSPGKLTISVHSDIGKLDLFVKNANESIIDDLGDFEAGDKSFICDYDAGTCFIDFERWNELYTGTYSFSLSFEPTGEKYDGNDDSVDAVRNRAGVPFCTWNKGLLARNDINDFYKVTIPQTGKYKLEINSSINLIYNGIQNGSKESIYYEKQYKGLKNRTLTLKKGVYFMNFTRYDRSSTGTYSFCITLCGASLSKVKGGKKSVKVTWKKGTANGYEIQIAKNRKFTKGLKTLTVKNAGAKSKTIKKLKSKKAYYVRMRSFIKSEGHKYYSDWSKVKKVKVK